MTIQPSPSASAPAGAGTERADNGRKSIEGRRKSYGRTAKKGALWSVLRQGGNELVAIPTSMVMARLLSPADFGIAAAATFFVLLAARLTQFGFSTALVRIKELRPEHLASVFVVNLAMGVVTYVALVGAAPLIASFFRSAEAGALLPLAALTFLITPFGTVSNALIQRRMQFRYTAAADWTDTAVGAVVTVLLAFLGYGYWSIVYGHVVAVAVRALLLLYLAEWRPTLRFSREALRELLPFGLGLQTKRLVEYASFNLDNLVVGRMIGMSALGFYDKAFTTMNRLVTRLTFGHAAFRIFAIIHEDRERFRRAYSRLILGATLTGFPTLAGCVVVAEPLFVVLYGEPWLPAVLPFKLLCLGGMLKLLNAYSSQANEAAGNLWPQVRRQAVGAVLIVIGAAVGSFYWGVTGAASGVLMAMIILTISMQALVRRTTGLSWGEMLAPQVPALTCTALLVCVLLAVEGALRAMVPHPAAWQQLVAQAVAGGVFCVGFVLFSPFAAVREIVRETMDDMLPARALHAWNRLDGRVSRAEPAVERHSARQSGLSAGGRPRSMIDRTVGGSPGASGFASGLDPIRVMHVVYALRPGGMELGVVKLVNGLDPARVRSAICSTQPAGEIKGLLGPEVRLFELVRRKGNDPKLVWTLYRLFRRESPDVVHTHAWGTLVEGLMAARLAGVPVVVHGEHGTLQLRGYQRWVQRRSWSAADRLLSVSSRLAERMARETGFALDRIRTIRNGVDLSRFGRIDRAAARHALDLPIDATLVVAVGRLVPVKDHLMLLESVALLRRTNVEVTLVLAGEGPLKSALEARAASLGLDTRVRLLGHRPDVERVFAAGDIFVLSSESEGLSNTILEAMASELPVVATRVGGADEMVLEGQTGLLVPPRSPHELARALAEVLADAPKRRAMGVAGRARAESEFSLDSMVRRYEDLYREVTAAKSSRLSERRPAHGVERSGAA